MLLVGDVGGTKTVLAAFREEAGRFVERASGSFASKSHAGIEEMVRAFLDEHPTLAVRAACFGVPGPVVDGRCQTTNLPWTVDSATLATLLGLRHTALVNDLEAMAWGMPHLATEELHVLNRGHRPLGDGTVAVIAAGTGLGEAILWWDGSRHHAIPTEGGHADFAPRSEQEIDVYRYLRAHYEGHVSWERVLSGPGLRHLYEALRDLAYYPEAPAVAERMAREDPSAVITELGGSARDPLCTAALDMFATAYGAEAGNLALKSLALGGVYLGGGIAPRILPMLEAGEFMKAFVEKGRFAELLSGIPIAVALTGRAPLLGAARIAASS